MPKVRELIEELNLWVPFMMQESYDNSGVQIGFYNQDITGLLVTLDLSHNVLEEAIKLGANVIISHHPLLFKGIKQIHSYNERGRIIIDAIQHQISIISVHTNIDNYHLGVNHDLGKRLGLLNPQVLLPLKDKLKKLVVFVPTSHAESVREALFTSGCGSIGNYDGCSFNSEGIGSFRPGVNTNPFVGQIGISHYEPEIKIETIVTEWNLEKAINALKNVHPYEEVAYDVFPLENSNLSDGAGIVGDLEKEIDFFEYLSFVKETLNIKTIRHSANPKSMIKRVAICGGSGSFLISNAKNAGADIYITGDLKHHDFTENFGPMILADVGHWESEQFIPELLSTHISQKFSNFAVLIAQSHRNPVFCY